MINVIKVPLMPKNIKSPREHSEEYKKDELWNDSDVLFFICKHRDLSTCKEDYTLRDLELIKQKMELEKHEKRNQHRKLLDELLYK